MSSPPRRRTRGTGDGNHRRQGRTHGIRPGRRDPYVDTLAQALAPRGILFIYGGLSGEPTPYPHWPCAMKGLTLRGWVASEIWNHPASLSGGAGKILAGLAGGHLKPVIARTFHGLEQIAKANEFLESNQQVGKVVVEF